MTFFQSTKRGLIYCSLALSLAAQAQITIIDDFEGSEGRFNGSVAPGGISGGYTAGSANLFPTDGFSGTSSQEIIVDDNPLVNAADATAWRLRHLSGGGTPANNLTLASTGFLGFALRTTDTTLTRATIVVDDGTGNERGSFLSIIADGLWHIYEWDLDNAAQWEAAPYGTGSNGTVDAANVTIDGILFWSTGVTNADNNATFYIDYVAWNSSGSIAPIPEPTTTALAVLGGTGVVAVYIRRRRK